MHRTQDFIRIAAILVAVGGAARLIYTHWFGDRPFVLTGAVIRQDSDPKRQSPIANAKITVLGGTADENAKSDTSGLFKLRVHSLIHNQRIILRFEHDGYQPLQMPAGVKNQLYVVRMEPLVREPITQPDHVEATRIANVRLRYSVRNQTTNAVGSITKQFEVANTGDTPCRGRWPCSPDGKWKASTATVTLDAQKGNEFHNIRASCVAGPCPFTRIEPTDLSMPSRKIEITAFDWSDTASFLVEAEVTRTMTNDMVLLSYPFITGQTISFAVPAAAEGPCLIADINGEEIVFPLGPKPVLSWTTCTVEAARGGNQLYRCELKPGYHVQQ